MKIHSVFDPEFARYGRVMSGYDLEPLLATLEAVSPMPETGTAYVAEQPELMALPVAKALSDRAFGGLPVELGWCNGRNTKLNCLEYHRSSELNLGTEDFILLLGRREDMTDGYLDTATVAAFRVPAGTLIELYALLTPEERAECALVFFDHEENGLLGSSFFASRHRKLMRDKLLLNFDCVSDGDELMLVQSGRARRLYGAALAEAFPETPGKRILLERSSLAFYPSDQANFRCGVAAAALKRKPLVGLYLDRIHTPKDTVMQEENLHILAEGSRRLLHRL